MAKQEIYRPVKLPAGPVSSSDFISGAYDDEILKRIRLTVSAEAPVSERLLIKRVINSFGIMKAGSQVRPVVDRCIAAAHMKQTQGSSGTVYWKKTQDPLNYMTFRLAASEAEKRDVLDLADEETAAAVSAVIRGRSDVIYGDLARETAALLKPGGRFYLVHRPFRLAELIVTLTKYKLEPKRMKMVHPFIDKEPNMVLMECVRGGNSRMTVEAPLIVYKEQGVYTDEIYDIYGY